MPRIQLKHVVSFTSEDLKNPADNLLKPEDHYKWRCATPGENKCLVELQFERVTQIHSVDVGNNGSAFVEILVGRSSWDPSEEYKVLLAASSFMSPSESKSGTAAFRVRMFGPDKLNKPVAAERWDRAKVVCTQPYNKVECYGLSFVTFHSPPESENDEEKNTATKTLNFKNKIGKFTLKEESDVDDIQIGSYFAKRLQQDKSLASSSTAASARDASSSMRLNALASTSSEPSSSILPSFKTTDHSASLKQKESLSSVSKQKPSTLASSDTKKQCRTVLHSSNTKQANVVEHSKNDEELKRQNAKQEGSKRKFEEAKATTNIMEQEGKKSAPPTKKVKRRNKNRKLPFHRMMRNVVFVLSGYKNPQRSNLRQQAVSMGAQYRPDWEPGCTHLICAFKNTPKYIQVLGKGKIVSDRWISECAKKHERLSIKQYRLDGGSSSSESGSSDSEDNDARSGDAKKPSIEVATEDVIRTDTARAKLEEPLPGPSHAGDNLQDDEYDTEDELRRAREAISCSTKDDEGKNDEDDDEYGGTTEDESDDDRKDEHAVSGSIEEPSKVVRPDLPPLPNYFNHEHFLIYGDLGPIERRRLVRYITAYNGVVCDYMNDNIKYVLSDKDWDRTFDETAASNSLLEFIRPSWIIKCHEEGKRVSTNDFQILRA